MTTSETLRRNALAERRSMGAGDRAVASSRIARAFLRSRHFYSSATIGCYIPMHDEVDTMPIFERAWRAGKRIFSPVVLPKNKLIFAEVRRDTRLSKSAFGLWEPQINCAIRAQDLDVCVVPTVVFDAENNRIGMGGGYYDRAFEFSKRQRSWRKPRLIGVAFDCQRTHEIQPNQWDVALQGIVTESNSSVPT